MDASAVDKLEPEIKNLSADCSVEQATLVSIAISLKRLADFSEGNPLQQFLLEMRLKP